MAMMTKLHSESGSVLINVLLISILISILMASSFIMINASNVFFTNDLNQAQAYYNGNTGLLIGLDKINNWVNNIPNINTMNSGFSYSQTSTTTEPWSVEVTEISQTSNQNSSGGITYTLTFQIDSIGYFGNEHSKLTLTKMYDVTT